MPLPATAQPDEQARRGAERPGAPEGTAGNLTASGRWIFLNKSIIRTRFAIIAIETFSETLKEWKTEGTCSFRPMPFPSAKMERARVNSRLTQHDASSCQAKSARDSVEHAGLSRPVRPDHTDNSLGGHLKGNSIKDADDTDLETDIFEAKRPEFAGKSGGRRVEGKRRRRNLLRSNSSEDTFRNFRDPAGSPQHHQNERERDQHFPIGMLARSSAAVQPTRTAPTSGPNTWNRPPTAAKMTSSAERAKPVEVGVTMPWCEANRHPASAAIAADRANAAPLTICVGNPSS